MNELLHRFPRREGCFQLFSHPDCLLHEVGEGHPETAARLQAVLRGCAQLSADLPISFQVPVPARVAELERAHDRAYLMQLKIAALRGMPYFMSQDNHICEQTFRAVQAAGGAALALADCLLGQGAGFALVRPPGHHAGRQTAEGFCFINHAALVIETLRLRDPQAKFLTVDFDVHHGNGLSYLYDDDPRVFYFSLHGEPEHIFPNTGHCNETGQGAGHGCTCNITLPLECSGDRWLEQFSTQLRCVEQRFRPDYLLVNAGFDAHREDPFGLMNVEDCHFLAAVDELQALAAERCGGRIGLFLEGGYSPAVLERLVPQVITSLALNHAGDG